MSILARAGPGRPSAPRLTADAKPREISVNYHAPSPKENRHVRIRRWFRSAGSEEEAGGLPPAGEKSGQGLEGARRPRIPGVHRGRREVGQAHFDSAQRQAEAR